MLVKKITYDHQILEDGQIQVRRITRIMEDDKEISKIYHRHCVDPISDLQMEDDRTNLIAGAIYTAEFVRLYKEEKARIESELNV